MPVDGEFLAVTGHDGTEVESKGEPELGFPYRFHPPAPGSDTPSPVVLLLHEGGGGEGVDFPTVDLSAAGAAVLRPEGKVDDNGLARYFRRDAEGAIDEKELHR